MVYESGSVINNRPRESIVFGSLLLHLQCEYSKQVILKLTGIFKLCPLMRIFILTQCFKVFKESKYLPSFRAFVQQ